jgi:hypothetical protein
MMSAELMPLCAGEQVGCTNILSLALRERYRCPQDLLDFALAGELSADSGYFRFGPRTICYGRSCMGARESQLTSSLFDTLKHVSIHGTKLRLPFDPTEVIDNLRLEHYADQQSLRSSYQTILRRLYYIVRPLTNPAVRRQIQRFHAHNWRKRSFPHWPVDTTVETLCETLLSLALEAAGTESVPFVWFWPGRARACVMMTHDVETAVGRDYCADLMDVDDSFGVKASFQIVPEGRYSVSPSFLEKIRDRGFEIAIQDLNHDGRLFENREEFLRRVRIINRYATEYAARGFRSAVLYRKPEWYNALNFSFDMSIPNVAHLDPQRGGCCTVMPYFVGDILELPVTTTQDYTLFNLLNQRTTDLWKSQTELIMERNGLASFIVHPDYVREDDTRSAYKDLLGYLRSLCEKSDIWFALPSDVDGWWRERSNMSVVKVGDSWRVDGEGAERAVLAYARNVDGNLVYELASAAGAS